KPGHLVENCLNLGNNVLAVNKCSHASRCAKCDMQCGKFFRSVDVFSAKHRVNPCLYSGLICQLHEQFNRVLRDPVLRIVEIYPCPLGYQMFATPGIASKQGAEMLPPHFLTVTLQRPPCRTLGLRSKGEWYLSGHIRLPFGSHNYRERMLRRLAPCTICC